MLLFACAKFVFFLYIEMNMYFVYVGHIYINLPDR